MPVQKAAAELLIRRKAVDYYATLKPYLDPKSDPELRSLALVGRRRTGAAGGGHRSQAGQRHVSRPASRAANADQAVDWFLAYGTALPPPVQADVMVSWLAAVDTAQPTAAVKLKK